MLCFILFLTSTFAFNCLNEVGKPVDSWVILKKPQGTVYFYYDSTERIFQQSPYFLNDSSSGALAHTVKQLWQEEANYVIYNDQVPAKQVPAKQVPAKQVPAKQVPAEQVPAKQVPAKQVPAEQVPAKQVPAKQVPAKQVPAKQVPADLNASKFGHTKGLFAFSSIISSKGFWITHSLPLFPIGPLVRKVYSGIGSNAYTYAQHLLCLSLNTPTINDLSKAFQLNRPQIYESKLSAINDHSYTAIRDLIDGVYSKEKRCDIVPLQTIKGLPFTIYAKTAEWNDDLYSGCVTPNQSDSLWVESWIRGSAEGPSCPESNYDTLDIKTLDFTPFASAWSETQDHSKWAIIYYTLSSKRQLERRTIVFYSFADV